MTLENLVVYGGIVLGIWLIGIVTILVADRRRRPVLQLDSPETRETRYAPRPGPRAGHLRPSFGQRWPRVG